MILVCGGLADQVTELVCARLAHCGYAYRLLDLASYPAGFQIAWQWQGNGPRGYIAGPDWHVDLDELTGVYVRFLGPEGRMPPPDIEGDIVPAMYLEYDAGLMALLEDLPCAVVNRFAGGMSNSSKAYQALLVRQCGLLTPPTLVTNDPVAARRFYRECQGEVIYKSLSGIRSIVRRLEPAQLARLSLLRHGPVQFQSFIPGENIRVHTVAPRCSPHACMRTPSTIVTPAAKDAPWRWSPRPYRRPWPSRAFGWLADWICYWPASTSRRPPAAIISVSR